MAFGGSIAAAKRARAATIMAERAGFGMGIVGGIVKKCTCACWVLDGSGVSESGVEDARTPPELPQFGAGLRDFGRSNRSNPI